MVPPKSTVIERTSDLCGVPLSMVTDCTSGEGWLKDTGAEVIPSAMTANEYCPLGRPAGSANCVVTGVLPVATPVLLQLYVRTYVDIAVGGRELHDRIVFGHFGIVAVVRPFRDAIELRSGEGVRAVTVERNRGNGRRSCGDGTVGRREDPHAKFGGKK